MQLVFFILLSTNPARQILSLFTNAIFKQIFSILQQKPVESFCPKYSVYRNASAEIALLVCLHVVCEDNEFNNSVKTQRICFYDFTFITT